MRPKWLQGLSAFGADLYWVWSTCPQHAKGAWWRGVRDAPVSRGGTGNGKYIAGLEWCHRGYHRTCWVAEGMQLCWFLVWLPAESECGEAHSEFVLPQTFWAATWLQFSKMLLNNNVPPLRGVDLCAGLNSVRRSCCVFYNLGEVIFLFGEFSLLTWGPKLVRTFFLAV